MRASSRSYTFLLFGTGSAAYCRSRSHSWKLFGRWEGIFCHSEVIENHAVYMCLRMVLLHFFWCAITRLGLMLFSICETTQQSLEFSRADLVFGHPVRGPLRTNPGRHTISWTTWVYFGSSCTQPVKWPAALPTSKNKFCLCNNNQHLMCWSLLLQDFNIEIHHKKESDNVVADALSRVGV